MPITRRAFVLGALATLVAHHRPGHGKGTPTPTPTPTPSPTPTPLGFYSDTYSDTY